MRFSVLSGKTKSAREAVFCGNFHIIWGLCLILRKFARRGASVFRQKGCRDLDTPASVFIFLLIFSQKCDTLILFWR
nr:MAG TPA: hypothetical protein [Caudoviricetes sp.]